MAQGYDAISDKKKKNEVDIFRATRARFREAVITLRMSQQISVLVANMNRGPTRHKQELDKVFQLVTLFW